MPTLIPLIHETLTTIPEHDPRLGAKLVRRELITEQQLKQALELKERSNAFLGQILVDLGFISATKLGPLLAAQFGVSYVDLLSVQPDADAVALVSEEVCRGCQAIPLRLRNDELEVAMADPLDVAAIDRIHIHTGRRVRPVLTMAGELQRTINDFFDAGVRT